MGVEFLELTSIQFFVIHIETLAHLGYRLFIAFLLCSDGLMGVYGDLLVLRYGSRYGINDMVSHVRDILFDQVLLEISSLFTVVTSVVHVED